MYSFYSKEFVVCGRDRKGEGKEGETRREKRDRELAAIITFLYEDDDDYSVSEWT